MLSASRESLSSYGLEVARQIAAVSDALEHALRWQLLNVDSLPNSSELAEYLTFSQGHLPTERASAIFLDGGHRILADEIIAEGTVDAATIHIRSIIGRAIDLGATGLIIAHNHPSGDPTPSAADVTLTRRIVAVAAGCDIQVIDHIIVARGKITSLRQSGLM